ncbi:hypothetical protein BKA70DRAFT_1557084 [Coprinopsis sp. MPI-PUGE-AT-0042]|nr:hypothetical protein BKA70DRAFT_1557084 [Coprinopsis sp. MPI-PUGE-AT-0042]
MQKLPIDILLHLVSDHLQNDSGSLQAMSLLCRDVRPLSQRYLFRSITVMITTGTNCQSRTILQSLATISKELLSSIKELHLINSMRYDSNDTAATWCRDLGPLFDHVVKRFIAEGKIKTLSVDRIFGEMGITDDAQTRALLEQLCQSPSIRDLELTQLPAELLRLPFPTNLKHLTCRHMFPFSHDSHEGDNNGKTRSRVALESLAIYPEHHPQDRVTRQPVHFLSSPANTNISLATLKYVAAHCLTQAHTRLLAGILQACKGSLQSLDLKSYDRYGFDELNYGLEEFPNLRKLWLTVSIGARSFSHHLQPVERILTPGHPSGSFRTLESLVILVASTDWKEYFSDAHPRSFESFGSQLCVKGRLCYPCLREVVVCFVQGTEDRDAYHTPSNCLTWVTVETPEPWDLAMRDAMRPLEALRIEVKIKWMACNRQMWYSWMKDSGI